MTNDLSFYDEEDNYDPPVISREVYRHSVLLDLLNELKEEDGLEFFQKELKKKGYLLEYGP